MICGVVHHAAVVVARQSMMCADGRCFSEAAGQRARLLSWELLHVFWWVVVKCPERHCGGVVEAALTGLGPVSSLGSMGETSLQGWE